MSYRGWFPKTVRNPRGAWTLPSELRQGDPSRASIAQNVRFNPGVAESRPGTSAVLSVASKVTGIYNWLTPITDNTNGNLVLYQEGNAIKRMRFSDGRVDTLISGVTCRAPSFADLGPRIYIAGYGTNGYGTVQCKVHDGDFTNGNPNIDLAFRGPLTLTAATATDSGAGFCTAGTHYLGIVFQTRSGFAGRPTTTFSGSPISITLGSNLRTIDFQITFDSPTDAGGLNSFIYPIITRADNPAKWYFVPDASFSPPYNVAGETITFSISVTDEDLADNAESADDQFNLLIDGSGAPTPSFVVGYGRRMCYGAGTSVYISDINDPQAITEDLSRIELPSKRRMGFAFPLAGSSDLFLTGDKWTGRTSDNGDSPSTWTQPTMISDAIGAPFPDCVEYRTAGNYAWIAAESGLYLFAGTYSSHPITYLYADQWKRINWAAAYAVKVKDDVVNLRCYVAAPLDGATEPTHVFVIDYQNGLSSDTCDISVDTFPTAVSSLGIVKEAAGDTAVWIGPAAAGSIVHFDETTHNDVGAAIHSTWESALIRQANEIQSETIRVGGANIWIHGAGSLIQTWYNQDRTVNVQPLLLSAGCTPASLSSAPGEEYTAKFDLSPVENYSARFEVNEVGGWFRLSGFKAYAKPSLYSR